MWCQKKLTRRNILTGIAAVPVLAATSHAFSKQQPNTNLTRLIPSSGQRIPAIGMGTWITFNVGDDPDARRQRAEVLKIFHELGGGLIDSSPMYGSSEDVLGEALEKQNFPKTAICATKVWINGREEGITQLAQARKLWRLPNDRPFDLLQIHNMMDWKTHIKTLRDMKENGQVRYIGVTTSHGRRHNKLAHIMKTQPIDFVQLTYNIADREVERTLLPLAQDRGIAIIANRPFQRGHLFRRVKNTPLPSWAEDAHCANWAEFFLKFVVSHPAMTCAIPATSKTSHMRENMAVLRSPLPEPDMRNKMVNFFEGL